VVTSSSTCQLATSSQSSVLSLSSSSSSSGGSCTALINGTHTSGSSSVGVNVLYDVFSTAVRFRVWYPISVRVSVNPSTTGGGDKNAFNSSITLRQISRTECSPLRQSAKYAVMATIGGSGLSFTGEIDVTSFVNVISTTVSGLTVSSSSSILSLDTTNAILTAVNNGTEVLTVNGISSTVTVSANATVIVEPEGYANVQDLDVVLVTSGAFQLNAPSSVSEPSSNLTSASFDASVRLSHVLTQEGHSGNVVVYANFEDGSRMEVSRRSGVSVTSLATNELSVNGNISSGWFGVVNTGAVSRCGYLIHAEWQTCEDIDARFIEAHLYRSIPDLKAALQDVGVGVTEVNITTTTATIRTVSLNPHPPPHLPRFSFVSFVSYF
jgi:hypothetical protein